MPFRFQKRNMKLPACGVVCDGLRKAIGLWQKRPSLAQALKIFEIFYGCFGRGTNCAEARAEAYK